MQWMSADPIVCQKKMPSDDVPRQMLTLLLELLKSSELSGDDELLIGGAFVGVDLSTEGRPSLASTANVRRRWKVGSLSWSWLS